MKNKKLYIALILIGLFIIDTVLVMSNLTTPIDNFFRNLIYSNTSEFVSGIMHNITFLGSTAFIVSMCAVVFIYLMITKRKNSAFSCAGILVLSTIVNNIIKIIIRRPRPDYISVVESTFSFPSGHMMGATTFYGFLIYLLIKSDISKKYKIIYSILLSFVILSVGVSRIYLGAHFASDIIGGMLLSLSLIFLFGHLNDRKNILE